MYGTIAKMKVKPGSKQDFIRFGEHMSDLQVKGYKGTALYQMDKDPNEFYVVVMFDNKETYIANANDPEQNKRFKQMMEYLVGEPDWHDGEIVYIHMA